MNYLDISLITLFFLLAYFYLNYEQKENFENNITNITDQYACYPGTYWRSNTYNKICESISKKHPQRMTTDGENFRTPDRRYQLVCKTNDHLQRDCRLVKINDKFY